MRAREFKCFYTIDEYTRIIVELRKELGVDGFVSYSGRPFVHEFIDWDRLTEQLYKERCYDVGLRIEPLDRSWNAAEYFECRTEEGITELDACLLHTTSSHRMFFGGMVANPKGKGGFPKDTERLVKLLRTKLEMLCPYDVVAEEGKNIYEGLKCSEGAVEAYENGIRFSWRNDFSVTGKPVLP